jgi:hypothetical protein
MMKERRRRMKTTKKRIPSTDYFFEALYDKIKLFLSTKLTSKIATIKILTIINWFKDIN